MARQTRGKPGGIIEVCTESWMSDSPQRVGGTVITKCPVGFGIQGQIGDFYEAALQV